jgi:membrane protease YdiL (CAAX protease family)
MSALPEEFPTDPEQNTAPEQAHDPLLVPGPSVPEEYPGVVTAHDCSPAELDPEMIGALSPEREGTGFSPYMDHRLEEEALAPEREGTGFSPYMDRHLEEGALAPEGFSPLAAQVEPDAASTLEPPLFAYETAPPPQPRIPHLGHLLLLLLLAIFALLCAGGLSQVGLHYHLFGISSTQDAMTDIHYTLGSEAILYLIALAGSVFIFPLIWHESFFAGVSWHAATAKRLSPLLIGAAFVCFLLAVVNGWLMPGPPDAPIDKMFRMPGAAWLLFGFGVTFAPFFEELVFRGFLLPSLCTACDWTAEKAAKMPPRALADDGTPQWSLPAMIVASILTSLPFAAMHAAQTGYSWGPFLLLVGVSLVLCGVRLATRSLASSVLVHACYNFMLFSLMLFGTGGFKHLENM